MNPMILAITYMIFATILSYLASFIVFNACVNNKLTKNLGRYLIIASIGSVADVLISLLIDDNFIKQIIFLVLLGSILGKLNGKSKLASISVLTCIVTVACIINLGIFILFNNLKDILSWVESIFIFAPIISTVIYTCSLLIIIKIKHVDILSYLEKNKVLHIFVLNSYICITIFSTDMVSFEAMNISQMIEFLILGIALVGGNIIVYRVINSELEEKKRLEVHREYSLVLNNLIDEFRANQHEYKNHLSTLSAIVHLDEKNKNLELSKNVDSYIEEIIRNDKYSKLMHVDNIIVKAIIYNNISRFDQQRINFVYDIKSNLNGINLQETDLSILLNNLLNNAMEATKGIQIKNVRLSIYEQNRKYIIKSENTIENKNIDYAKIFEKKESSKGENRGFGLYNVKNIVGKYKGNIEISIEKNYFILTISF